jgi:hypothetical protein
LGEASAKSLLDAGGLALERGALGLGVSELTLGVSALVVHRSGFHLGGVHGFAGMLKTVGSLIHRTHGGGTGDGEGFDFRGRFGEGGIEFSDANFALECGLDSILPSGSAVNDAGAGDETSLQRREGKAGMLGAHAEGGFEVFDNQDIAEKLTRKNRSLAVAFHAIAGTPKDSKGN